MAGDLVFLVGGARSGKSALAVDLGKRHQGPVLVLATAEAFDDDMHDRIVRHRAERPDWPTVEEPVQLAAALRHADSSAPDAGGGTMVVVDCLTVWVANLFARGFTQADREHCHDEAVAALGDRRGATVVISNEVGLGIHPDTALGREYRDELGRLNQRVAAIAGRTLFLVAGRALALTDPWEHLA